MKFPIGLSLTTSFMMVAPVAYSQSPSVDTKSDIQKMATTWMGAYNKKDVSTSNKTEAKKPCGC
jgi:hypothetical protein